MNCIRSFLFYLDYFDTTQPPHISTHTHSHSQSVCFHYCSICTYQCFQNQTFTHIKAVTWGCWGCRLPGTWSSTLTRTFLALSARAGDGRTVQFLHMLLRDLLPHTIQTAGGRGRSDLQAEQLLDERRARSDCGHVNLLEARDDRDGGNYGCDHTCRLFSWPQIHA